MARKSVTSELRLLVDRLPHLSPEDLQKALDKLQSLGVEIPEGPKRRPGITCPFTETQLVDPCALSGCPYYVENEWSRNCMLEYLDAQGKDSLETEEIAFLLQIHPDKVEAAITQGMSQLRENSEETVGISGDFKRSQEPVFEPNLDEDDEFQVTRLTVEPPFMSDVNEALALGSSLDEVFRHPAIRLLGVLDSIISELE